MRSSSDVNAVLCLVKESMYLPVRCEEDAAVELDAKDAALASMPLDGVVHVDARDLTFVDVLFKDGLVALVMLDVDALAAATFDAAILRVLQLTT